ncbi:MAG: exosortase/archaeosortase family protein [bacterium]
MKNTLNNAWDRLHEHSSSGTLFRLGLFFFLYFIGRYFISFLERSALFSTLFTSLHQPFLWFIDKVSIGFWSFFYPGLSCAPDHIVIINNTKVIQLFPGCSGLQPMLRMTFILLLYPLPWKTKSWLFPLSWFIILFAATVHFILLIPIAYHWPEWYTFSHNWLTRIIFYSFYFLTWLIWEKIGGRKPV